MNFGDAFIFGFGFFIGAVGASCVMLSVAAAMKMWFSTSRDWTPTDNKFNNVPNFKGDPISSAPVLPASANESIAVYVGFDDRDGKRVHKWRSPKLAANGRPIEFEMVCGTLEPLTADMDARAVAVISAAHERIAEQQRKADRPS